MLARNFKTAEQLKIDPRLFGALVKVLHRLERDELKHYISDELYDDDDERDLFNMAHWGVHHLYGTNCGSPACICGWAVREMGVKHPLLAYETPLDLRPVISFVEDNNSERVTLKFTRALHCLFNPPAAKFEYHKITPEQAARALSNYLTTGWPRWEEAICGD